METKTVEYIPFGEEWRKEMRKMSIKMLTSLFDVEKLVGEKKEDLIDKVRIKRIVEVFNKYYPVGSLVQWKPTTRSEAIEVTVKHPAYPHYGQAVAFFEERSGFCSIEPQFLESPLTQ